MKHYEPSHTFTKAPSIPQIISYCVLLTSIVIFSTCLQNNISSFASRIALMTMYYFSFLAIMIAGILTSCTDPADSYLKQKEKVSSS